MKYISIALWLMTVVLAALLFFAAIFIHSSIVTFGLATAAFIAVYVWWYDEIREMIKV